MPITIKGDLPKAAPPPPEPELPKADPKKSEAMEVLAAMAKEKGRPVFVKGSQIPQCTRRPTGILEYDNALGGGFLDGRINVVYGKESVGKTDVCLAAMGVMQRQDRLDNKAVLIDIEGTFDPKWARHRLDPDKLIVVKAIHGEEASDIVDGLMHSDDVGIIAIDSLACMSGMKELNDSAEQKMMGGSAFIVNQMVKKILWGFNQEFFRKHFPCVILLNQPRMSPGNPPTMYLPGGRMQVMESSLTIKHTAKKRIEKSIDPLNPAWLDVECEVRKCKIGISRSEFKYSMRLIADDTMKVGDTDSWGTVNAGLKGSGNLVKVPHGWQLMGKTYPTLVPIADRYQKDPAFRLLLQQIVVKATMAEGTQLIDKIGGGEA